MIRNGRRMLWHFHDRFYWDDDEFGEDDVKALVLQRQRRQPQKLQSARSLMCDSNFDIQYDHILPVALGGATTIENLQLLCADCNRRKSDSL